MSDLTNEKKATEADELRDEGNHCVLIQNFEGALYYYNRSLFYDSQDKISLALTYAARSSVCFECNEFEACLRNIQLAMDHNYPQNKIAVLIERKYKCLKLMESNLKRGNHWEFLKLSYPANEKVPSIVGCLELDTDKMFGHIITNKDLKVGDIVAIEKPFTTVLTKISYDRCSTCCTKKSFDIMPCSDDDEDMFCSGACKELAMKTFHRTESRIINEKYGTIPMRMYMNALVLFGGSIEDLREFLCANQSHSRIIFDYDFSSSDEIENDKYRLLALLAFIDEVDFTEKNIDQFVTYFLECAWKISNYDKLSLDKSFHGLYLLDCLLQRSYTPNSIALQFGTKRLHLVIRPILKGEQLFTSNRPCKSYDKNGIKTCSRLKYKNLCKGCEHEEELRKASSDLILHEPPKWPKTTWKSLDRYSTVKLATERFKNYCALLQSSPELLNNYNGVLITEYIITCLYKVISNKPISE